MSRDLKVHDYRGGENPLNWLDHQPIIQEEQEEIKRVWNVIRDITNHFIEVDSLGETVLRFGKHKGDTIKETNKDTSYMENYVMNQKGLVFHKLKLYYQTSQDINDVCDGGFLTLTDEHQEMLSGYLQRGEHMDKECPVIDYRTRRL